MRRSTSFCYSRAQGPVLVVGSRIYDGRPDWRETYPVGTGLDAIDGPGVDVVHNLEQPAPKQLIGLFGHIDCVSVFEHVERPWLAAQTIESMMRPGGSLFLSVPFVWRYHGYPHDYWRFTHSALPVLFPGIEWQAIKYESLGVCFDEPPIKYINGKERLLAQCEVVGFGVKKC